MTYDEIIINAFLAVLIVAACLTLIGLAEVYQRDPTQETAGVGLMLAVSMLVGLWALFYHVRISDD